MSRLRAGEEFESWNSKRVRSAMGVQSLFCYGTLQSPMVMKAVVGAAFSGKEAVLHGFARYRIKKTEYPAITAEEGSSVNGKMYWDLDEDAIAKLDAFEGDKYERVPVKVTVAGGEVIDAYAYAIKPEYRKLLSGDPWDFDRFLQNGLERWINWFVEDRRDLFDRGDL
ncbi:gamma-glutamylcyclotransferase family protein [Desulfogranum japonicum]|uniref:gamma-glutamylcyclotransferase family protein n=1 Tax=Desulfogranum japonicum TaxID=231447 RepID=UPI000687C180|nr:gamma-glutamylcyclotransferase family protein [Desulfogranum japonicum]